MQGTNRHAASSAISRTRNLVGIGSAVFVVAGLLLMIGLGDATYGIVVAGLATVSILLASLSPRVRAAFPRTGLIDRLDLVAVGAAYLVVVALFSLAFRVFTTDSTLWMFLSFGGGMLLGVVGPVLYTVWYRRRPLASLGLTLRGWRGVVAPAIVFAGVQFAITLWGYDLPQPVDWVPLLCMALTVGMFESIFFRGFVQGRLEASFGIVPAVAGAAILYSLYHVAYGMGAAEMAFLFGLGIVYAVAFRVANNILVLWPLLTPLGSLYAQLESGELAGQLPWAAIMGFADVIGLMVAVIWWAHRHERRQHSPSEGISSIESVEWSAGLPPRVPAIRR